MIVALTGTATAADTVTVQSLLRQDFAVVGAFTNQAGGGLVLQKKDQLFFCNVTENTAVAGRDNAILQAGRMIPGA